MGGVVTFICKLKHPASTASAAKSCMHPGLLSILLLAGTCRIYAYTSRFHGSFTCCV